MNPWHQVARDWARPSIQQSWYINKFYKPLHIYLTTLQESAKEYWKVWNSVKEPKGKDDAK